MISPGRYCGKYIYQGGRDDFDDAPHPLYAPEAHNMLIERRTAEDIKMSIGSVYEQPEPVMAEVREETFLQVCPKVIRLSSEETQCSFFRKRSRRLSRCSSGIRRNAAGAGCGYCPERDFADRRGSQICGLEDLLEESRNTDDNMQTILCRSLAIGTGRYAEFIEGMVISPPHTAGRM